MAGGREPDGMQSYRGREALAASPSDLVPDESIPVDLGPPLPEWKIKWRGVGALVLVVLALAVVSRVFGPSIASIIGVAALLSAAIWTMGERRSLLHQGGDAFGGGEFGAVGTGMDCGYFGGGGGGDS